MLIVTTIKILKVYFIWSFTLVICTLLIPVFLKSILGTEKTLLLVIPFDLFLAIFGGYKVTKELLKLIKFNKIQSILLGIGLGFIVSVFITILDYFLFGELDFSGGIIVMIATGVGGIITSLNK